MLAATATAALAAVSLGGPYARAANVTDTWLTASNGTWTDATKWSAAVSPNNGADTYTVTIGATGAAYTVTLNTSATVNSLTLNSTDATLSHTAGTFTATGGLNLTAGTYSLAGGTIANTTINATVPLVLTSSNGSLIGDTINGDLSLANGFARVAIGAGTTFTTAHLGGQGNDLGFVAGTTLSGTVLFEGAAPSGRFLDMVTAGAFAIGSTGVVKTAAGFTSDGQIGGSGFAFSAAMNLTNNGLVSSEVAGRTINIAASTFSNAGTIQALNGGILTISSNAYTNGGTIIVNGSTLNLGGTFNATGGVGNILNTGGGTVNVTGTINNVGSTLTLSNSTGSWNFVSGTISGGSVTLLNGQTLNFTSSTGVLNNVIVNGDLNFVPGFARGSITGATSFGTAHLSGQGAEIGFAGGSTLNGNVSFEGTAPSGRFLTLTSGGLFTIPATSIVQTAAGFTSDAQIGGSGFGFSGAMNLTNNGMISSAVSGRTIIIAAPIFTNAGTVSAINGGIVTLSGSYTNTGSFILNGSTLNLGGTFNTGSGIGNFSNSSGTVNITGTVNNTGNNLTLNNNTGSWNLVAGTISGGSLSFANGQTLNLTSSNGSLVGVTVNGDINFPTGFARVSIGAGTSFGTAHLVGQGSEIGFVGGSTLNGNVSFEGTAPSGRFLTLSSAGSLTISAAAVVKTAAGFTSDAQIGGSGFAFASAMNLTNNGLISSEVSGRTIIIGAPTFSNAGTVQAINGGIVNVNSNAYTNTGTFIVNASTLNMGGTFNTSGGIGNFSNTAGTVNLAGTVNNTGNNITLNSNTGSWNLLGGTISGGSLSFANGQTLNLTSSNGNLIGLTVNGDLNFPTTFARVLIGAGTTFNTAHLIGQGAEIGFGAGATLSGTVQAEGAAPSGRFVTMGSAGSFTIGATGVIKTFTGFGSDLQIGGNGFVFASVMNLTNNGLISSEVSGRTIIIGAPTFSNAGTVQAINGGIVNFNSGAYTNPGTIIVNASTVNLAGTFNASTGVGNIFNSGGTINITGTVNNTGNNLTLNSNTGSWNLLGGTISGGSVSFANGQSLNPTSTNGIIAGATVNGDLNFTNTFARALLSNGTTFGTAHLTGQGSEIGFAAGSTMSGSVSFEGTAPSGRYLTLSSSGSLTIPPASVVKTAAGFTNDAQIGGNGFVFTGAMNLTNNGLISSEVAGRTINIAASTFSSAGTVQALNGGKLLIANPSGGLGKVTTDGLGSLVRVGVGTSTYTLDQPVAVKNRATLNLQGNWTRSANIDASGRIIFDYPTAGPTVYSAIRSAIISGFNSGAWNGSGIFSTAAAANNATALGYAEASNVLTATGGTFSGETVDGTAVLVRWTYKGDANLDGQVDVTDLGRLATNWQTSNDWSGGDFNYDHFVDVSDLGALATSWQLGVGSPLGRGSFEEALAAVGLGGVAVPEPTVCGLASVAIIISASARKRRRNKA
jgi:hypothetical protein